MLRKLLPSVSALMSSPAAEKCFLPRYFALRTAFRAMSNRAFHLGRARSIARPSVVDMTTRASVQINERMRLIMDTNEQSWRANDDVGSPECRGMDRAALRGVVRSAQGGRARRATGRTTNSLRNLAAADRRPRQARIPSGGRTRRGDKRCSASAIRSPRLQELSAQPHREAAVCAPDRVAGPPDQP